MIDHISPERRSWLMSRVRSKDTTPELRVRQMAHRVGLRFRLHRRELPGKPDLVFPRLRTVIFVHGCFWHRHPGCSKASTPKSRTEFWNSKFVQNERRDVENKKLLKRLGWQVITIWECETKTDQALKRALRPLLITAKARP